MSVPPTIRPTISAPPAKNPIRENENPRFPLAARVGLASDRLGGHSQTLVLWCVGQDIIAFSLSSHRASWIHTRGPKRARGRN